MTKNNAAETAQVDSTEIDLIENTSSDLATAIEQFGNNTSAIRTSFTEGSFEEKMAVMTAITDSVKIDDNLDKVINLKNWVIQHIEVADEQTGQLVSVPRVMLIDEDGTSYVAISKPIMDTLEMYVQMFGSKDKDKRGQLEQAIPVKVKRVRTRRGFNAFNLVPASAK